MQARLAWQDCWIRTRVANEWGNCIVKCAIEPLIRERYPAYSAAVVEVQCDLMSLRSGATRAHQTLLQEVVSILNSAVLTNVTAHPHVSAWREVYRSFGASPREYRSSVELLLRWVTQQRPFASIHPLVDLSNAMSIRYQLPVGGEDSLKVGELTTLRYAGRGEQFVAISTTENQSTFEGEVVWADSAGVTCRCWNWRQSQRTAISQGTTHAHFVVDGLAPFGSSDVLVDAATWFAEQILMLDPSARIVRTLV